MNKQDEAKTAIMNAAAELIQMSEGRIEEITTRTIAEKAGVGTGLINYHFQTKERLIELCVQSMIHHVTGSFKPKLDENASAEQRVSDTLKRVADFLAGNQAVSRISIFGDFSKPAAEDNTMRTVEGLCRVLSRGNGGCAPSQKIAMFALVSTLQTAFLRKDITEELFGFAFNRKEERDRFIEVLVKQVVRGGNDHE